MWPMKSVINTIIITMIKFQHMCGTEPFPTDFRAKKYKVDRHFLSKVNRNTKQLSRKYKCKEIQRYVVKRCKKI